MAIKWLVFYYKVPNKFVDESAIVKKRRLLEFLPMF